MNVIYSFFEVAPLPHTVQFAWSYLNAALSTPLHIDALQFAVYFPHDIFDISRLCWTAKAREADEDRPLIPIALGHTVIPVNSDLSAIFEYEKFSVVVDS